MRTVLGEGFVGRVLRRVPFAEAEPWRESWDGGVDILLADEVVVAWELFFRFWLCLRVLLRSLRDFKRFLFVNYNKE